MDHREFLKYMNEGVITTEDIGRGMHLCYSNARSLIADAKALLKESPGRAISLSVLALEEIAKIFIFCDAAAIASSRSLSWKELKKKVNSHITKQEIFAAYGMSFAARVLAANGHIPYETDIPVEYASHLNWMKQLGFYVDWTHNSFSSPDRFGEENADWAEWLIEVAEERLESIERFHSSQRRSVLFAKSSGEFVAEFAKARTPEQFESIFHNIADRLKELEKVDEET